MPNPQLNELVDYIKKAKQAGQSDEQTRQVLLKNGWSITEINEAFQPVQQPQPQPQIQTQPKPQPQPQLQNKPVETKKTGQGVSRRFILNLSIILVALVIIGGGGYFALNQTSFIQTLLEKYLPYPASSPINSAVENQVAETPPSAQLNLATVKLATVPQDYNMSKGVSTSLFSSAGDKVAYCAPLKINNKIDCFLNSEKLSNSYSFNPYWIGISPSGNRVVFLYYDAVKKQSFVFENGVEGTRYNGTITSPNFSNDSQSFMFTVLEKGGKNFVVFNGTASPPHEKIYGAPSLSSDGRYLLYGARDGMDIFWVADQIK